MNFFNRLQTVEIYTLLSTEIMLMDTLQEKSLLLRMPYSKGMNMEEN